MRSELLQNASTKYSQFLLLAPENRPCMLVEGDRDVLRKATGKAIFGISADVHFSDDPMFRCSNVESLGLIIIYKKFEEAKG
jgi:hypothetical protein